MPLPSPTRASGEATGAPLRPGAPSGRILTAMERVAVVVASGLVAIACASEARGGPKVTLELTSSAFSPGGEIPSLYTCEGRDISPPLAWKGMPPATKSLVLIVDDPDAPDPKAPKRTWVHWVLVDLSPDTAALPEGT